MGRDAVRGTAEVDIGRAGIRCRSLVERLCAAIDMPQDIAKPKVGRRGHHWRTSKGRPPQYSADYQNPFGAAAKILQINSDIRLRIMLGERVSKHTIRDWRRGKDKAPAWAFDVLARESDRLRAIVDQADIWLARAQKEAAEAAS